MTSRYFSTSQAAKICQVTSGSVIRWIKEGVLETALTVGGHRRIPAASLLKLIKKLYLPVPEELSSLCDEKNDTELMPRILVVDDEKSVREMVRWIISQEWPGATVEEAEDGFVAGWKIHGFCPDLVILDLMMPGLDGFRFCEFIQNLPEMKHMKIIAISGVPGFGYQEKIMKLGADVFLAKPFDNEIFKKKIQEQLKWVKANKSK